MNHTHEGGEKCPHGCLITAKGNSCWICRTQGQGINNTKQAKSTTTPPQETESVDAIVEEFKREFTSLSLRLDSSTYRRVLPVSSHKVEEWLREKLLSLQAQNQAKIDAIVKEEGDVEKNAYELGQYVQAKIDEAVRKERDKFLLILSKLREMNGDERPRAIDGFIENILVSTKKNI